MFDIGALADTTNILANEIGKESGDYKGAKRNYYDSLTKIYASKLTNVEKQKELIKAQNELLAKLKANPPKAASGGSNTIYWIIGGVLLALGGVAVYLVIKK